MDFGRFCKPVLGVVPVFALLFLSACTQNPLTGRQEFTGLMPAEQEQAIGASQHAEIVKQYGGVYPDKELQAYVDKVGQKVAAISDRKELQYHFTVLDSPVVNAFALPGGYIYITRGSLAIANTEDELAAVLGHEVGHVAARHQASRYSQGVLSSLGVSVLSAAIGVPEVSQALSLGTNLYMSSYSRDQEIEADKLGTRYLSRAGYNTLGMSNFLEGMDLYLKTDARIKGKQEQQADYFSSHPDTGGRVVTARAEAAQYGADTGRPERSAAYLQMLRGMTFGDNPAEGFRKGDMFYHTDIGFALDIPAGANVDNRPDQLIVEGREGTVLVFDMVPRSGARTASEYVGGVWLKGQPVAAELEPLSVNGFSGATTAVGVTVGNRPAQVRLVALDWNADRVVRMQMLLPQGVSESAVNDMKRMTYSFRKLSASEKSSIRPYRVDLVKAGVGDTPQTMARFMAEDGASVDRFRALNGLSPGQSLTPGTSYKVVR